MVLVPETPPEPELNLLSTFGSYTSNPSGNLISGFLSSFMFPFPEITTLMVAAWLVFRLPELSVDVRLKLPTAPENVAGFPARGSSLTFTVTAGAVSVFSTLV